MKQILLMPDKSINRCFPVEIVIEAKPDIDAIDLTIEYEGMSESLNLCLSKREAEELFYALKEELKARNECE
ncbi:MULTISPECIES: hypothetical protein [unclassified Enterococcus]|uniref:hypothetical protein n=1 Tax=unclassified Enterococcus TaxID=2608891 RepID=UPI003F25390F